MLKHTLPIPTPTTNKNLPANIVSVIKTYFIIFAIIEIKFANKVHLNTPQFGTIIPPNNEPIATPTAAIIVVIVIKLIYAEEPSASQPSFLSRTKPACPFSANTQPP